MRPRRFHPVAAVLAALLPALAVSCTGERVDDTAGTASGPPSSSREADDSARAASATAGAGASPTDAERPTYERSMVLLSPDADSLLAVAWLFTARTDSASVGRSAEAHVLHGRTWETFNKEEWEGPLIREPWRIMPHASLRVLVGLGDVIERIVLDDPSVHAELVLGDVLTEWSGPRGGTYHVLEGEMVLGDDRVAGLGLDLARSWTSNDSRHGDWAFLVSGDSLQVVLYSPTARPPGSGAWRAWARLDFRDLRWPVLTMQWPEVRSFEAARRDVPVAWSVVAPDGEVTIDLSSEAAQLEAGEGEGAQLPVFGLFGVQGTLSFEGALYPVRGLLRHVQP